MADGYRRVTVSLDDDAKLGDLLRSLLASGVTIHACDRVESGLEDAFGRILEADEEPA